METYAVNSSQTDPTGSNILFFLRFLYRHLSAFVSPAVILLKLDLYSLLPLSLVSLSRNSTKGGRRSSSLWWGLDVKSVLSELMELRAHNRVRRRGSWCEEWACVYVHRRCICECIAGPRGIMLAACVTAARAGLAKKPSLLYSCLNVSSVFCCFN